MERRSSKPPAWAIGLLVLFLAVVFYFVSVPRGAYNTFTKEQSSQAQAAVIEIDRLKVELNATMERLEYIQRQRYQDWVEKNGFKRAFQSENFPSCLFDNKAYEETYQIRLVTEDFVIIAFDDNKWLYTYQDLTWQCMQVSPTNAVDCLTWCAPVAEPAPEPEPAIDLEDNSTTDLDGF